MTNGLFKRLNVLGYARASTVMSNHSKTRYEWSIKLIGSPFFTVGIASQLNRESVIHHYDENAIVYVSEPPNIRRGSAIIHSDLKEVRSEDVISFKFQPDTKKLIIEWVSNRHSSYTNLQV